MATFLRRFSPQRRQSMEATSATGHHSPVQQQQRRRQSTNPSAAKMAPPNQAVEDDDDAVTIRALLQEENESHQMVVWMKSFCDYCEAALLLKEMKGLDAKVHDLSKAPQGHLVQRELERMTTKDEQDNNKPPHAKNTTFIFIHGKHVGGNRELQDLYHTNKLEKLLFPGISDNDQTYRAIWKGVVLAKSPTQPLVVGLGQYYFAPESIRWNWFHETSTTVTSSSKRQQQQQQQQQRACGSKGEATYYTIRVNKGRKYTNGAWTYKQPIVERASHLKDHVAFCDEVGIFKGLEQVQSNFPISNAWGSGGNNKDPNNWGGDSNHGSNWGGDSGHGSVF